MEITKTEQKNGTVLHIVGRIDSVTSDILNETMESLNPNDNLTLDLQEVEYISSAGLRVLIKEQKRHNPKARFVLTNVCAALMDVFEVTGFDSVLQFE